jgi:hypothetical protein
VVSVTVERLTTPRGELVLRREGEHHEIVSNGVFLMDTRDGRSERELVRAALRGVPTVAGAPAAGPMAAGAVAGSGVPAGSGGSPGSGVLAGSGARVLIGGLGVGFSVAEALRSPGVAAVTVVEIEPAVVRWNRTHLGRDLADPRLSVVVADLGAWLRAGDDRYDAICLDVDNGPEWTVTAANAALYGDPGLDAVDRRLAPGGTLAVWSANAAPAFADRLRHRYRTVEVVEIPVARGEPDLVYLGRQPFPPLHP